MMVSQTPNPRRAAKPRRPAKPRHAAGSSPSPKTGPTRSANRSVPPGGESRRRVQTVAGLDAREIAARVLADVLGRHSTLDDALLRAGATSDGPQAPQSPRDRAFVRAIVATALRRKGQIEAAIRQHIASPLPADRGTLDAIMLVAGAQLLFLDTPPHAVINIAVAQTRGHAATRRFAKLANAVLRRVSENRAAVIASQDAPRQNTPPWLWDRWAKAYGADTARQIAAQHLVEPVLDLSVPDDAAGWAMRLGGELIAPGTVRLAHKGRIEDIAGYGDGAWWVQDVAAALPARLLGDVRGLRVADLCAAPGGKTAQLAAAGAHVIAVDQSAARLARVRENLARLRLQADLIQADATAWMPAEPLDAILLDAPCTATGTIRRHPDIAHVKRHIDIVELAQLQARLMDHAVALLRPGARLVYCTCSLEPEEGPQQIERALGVHPALRLAPIRAEEVNGASQWIAGPGWLRTLPHFLEPHGMDGFFIARLEKTR
jgi:16S rRNA (cytosine967-C5)-methyltransferase